MHVMNWSCKTNAHDIEAVKDRATTVQLTQVLTGNECNRRRPTKLIFLNARIECDLFEEHTEALEGKD
jgi:hypothetical protein